MFRIRILSAWVIMTMLFSACADWVNVSPKDEIEADKLFKSENGFKVALIGVYSRMTLLDNYGKRLSYDYIERLAQRYDNYAYRLLRLTKRVRKSMITRIMRMPKGMSTPFG